MVSVNVELEHFKLVVDHYKQDIREYWTKANFFFLANAGLLSGFIIFLDHANDFPLFKIALPLTGIVVAAFFYLILENSHYWSKRWRCEVLKLCEGGKKFPCYWDVEHEAQVCPCRHPEFWTQLLDLAFIFVWAGFLMINLEVVRSSVYVMGFVVANLFWVALLVGFLFYEKEKKPFEGFKPEHKKATANAYDGVV
ncbi:MAG: hypothetical protein NWF01_09540 [Candidatus Bathyarchaeota archaeon]|nr:hypothetical protein [Candidatus Bathyarchaeota archaeon]